MERKRGKGKYAKDSREGKKQGRKSQERTTGEKKILDGMAGKAKHGKDFREGKAWMGLQDGGDGMEIQEVNERKSQGGTTGCPMNDNDTHYLKKKKY